MKTERFSAGADFGQFVDVENGTIDREIFHDEDIYQEELHRIFARAWAFVAHESQLPKVGDFLTTYIGEDGVIVTRHRDQSIRVFVNSCAHRGNKVCFADAGNTSRFTCNYHGWSYDTTGTLTGMHAEYAYSKVDIDKTQTKMQPVAQVASYKGLVFATFDPDAPSLEDWLGDFRWYLDMLLDNEEGGTEFVGGCIKYEINANWKIGVENSIGDSLHVGWTHDSGTRAISGGQTFPDIDLSSSFHSSVNGHGLEFGTEGYGSLLVLGSSAASEYFNKIRPKMAERLGDMRAKIFGSAASAGIFPNCTFLPGISSFRVWLPKGPEKVEVRTWVIVNKAMPEELKADIAKHVMLTFAPGGIFDVDDGENWTNCTVANRGVVTRRQPLHYRLGIDKRVDDHPVLPGTVYQGQLSDSNQRLFYQRWVDLMEAKSIKDLPVRPEPRVASAEALEPVSVSAI
jgi:ethylbenzene dioxygenase alpha subunit